MRFFDQIRFFPVSGEELLEARAAFPHGQYPVRIEQQEFSFAAYDTFLAKNRADIAAFKQGQQNSFDAERQRWRDQGLDSYISDDAGNIGTDDHAVPEGCTPVHAATMGTVWKIEAEVGARVEAGQALVIIESMKMEVTIAAPASGRLRELLCQPGRVVKAGQIVAFVEEA